MTKNLAAFQPQDDTHKQFSCFINLNFRCWAYFCDGDFEKYDKSSLFLENASVMMIDFVRRKYLL